MPYEIEHTCYRQVFILPKVLVEKHLKLSGTLQLKVLIWMFYHQGVLENLDEIASDLGAIPSDVQDALQYWIANGIIRSTDEGPAVSEIPAEEAPAEPSVVKKEQVKARRNQKPTHFEVARRMNESQELSFLVCEAQNKFGRVLKESELASFTYLVDTYGLSPAIILMIVEYACSIEKCNMHYIETTGVDWAKKEIDTVEKAEKLLTEMERARLDWNRVCKLFGIDKRKPSRQEEMYIARWLHEWNFTNAMLQEAYDQAVNNTGKSSFSYINKVLENWHRAGYRKPSDIQSDAPKKHGGKLNRTSDVTPTSFTGDDLDELLS